MKIIIDEEKEAEKILKTGYVNENKPTETVKLLIKYWKQKLTNTQEELKEPQLELKQLKIILRNKIELFMQKNYVGFNATRWQRTLDRIVGQYVKDRYRLIKIDNIKITSKELNRIKEINNIELEKLAFTLLVYAKVDNQVNENNDDWVYNNKSEIFKDSMVKSSKGRKYSRQRLLYFADLSDLGYIEIASGRNTHVRLTYVDHSQDNVVITIDDVTKKFIGKYLSWRKGYCVVCGKKIEQANNKTKYCKKCAKEIEKRQERENAKLRMRKMRNKRK